MIHNKIIPIVKEAKNLGPWLDSTLSFEKHVLLKLRFAYSRLKKLYSCAKDISSICKLKFCESVILSLVDYGDVVYGKILSAKVKKKIQKLQNSCMCYIYGIPYRQDISP